MSALSIQTQGLQYRYGRQFAVKGIDLAVPPGAIYGFLGPNGAGKSTTIKLLLGLLQPTAGEATLFGRSMRQDRRAILRRTGALIEAPSLYGNLTARQNLQWLDRLMGGGPGRIEEVLELVGLHYAADKRANQFSMGMKQRLAIAMALFHDPDLLVLDEPSNGLDPAGIQEMRQLFLRLRDAGKTLFVSSHILAEIEKIATHVGIIDQGLLRFQGPIEQLRSASRPRTTIRTPDVALATELLNRQGIETRLLGENQFETSTREGSGLHGLLSSLIQAGVEIHHVETTNGTLEELFFELTLKKPEGAAEVAVK